MDERAKLTKKTWENAQLLLMTENGIERMQRMRELRAKVSELSFGEQNQPDGKDWT